jgi:hypothetical protein
MSAEETLRMRASIERAVLAAAANPSHRGAFTAIRDALREEQATVAQPRSITSADGIVGVPVAELATGILQRFHDDGWFGRSSHGYVRAVVLPALQARGLYESLPHRRLGILGTTTRWMLTPAGMDAKAVLEARLEVGGAALRGSGNRGLDGELRAIAASLGTSDAIDAAFAAIDAGVGRGWNDVYRSD